MAYADNFADVVDQFFIFKVGGLSPLTFVMEYSFNTIKYFFVSYYNRDNVLITNVEHKMGIQSCPLFMT